MRDAIARADLRGGGSAIIIGWTSATSAKGSSEEVVGITGGGGGARRALYGTVTEGLRGRGVNRDVREEDDAGIDGDDVRAERTERFTPLEYEMFGSDAKEDACAEDTVGTTEAKLGPPKVPWMVWMR